MCLERIGVLDATGWRFFRLGCRATAVFTEVAHPRRLGLVDAEPVRLFHLAL